MRIQTREITIEEDYPSPLEIKTNTFLTRATTSKSPNQQVILYYSSLYKCRFPTNSVSVLGTQRRRALPLSGCRSNSQLELD